MLKKEKKFRKTYTFRQIITTETHTSFAPQLAASLIKNSMNGEAKSLSSDHSA